ncbi:phage/plasmid primase, P4 family [Mesorhizobium sp. CAU 1732]|uniref:DNA primase family protein n=1 Tax=Mesorhizobium sp. CAU 1732 TaxID=3140358 RepID=UPI0032601385
MTMHARSDAERELIARCAAEPEHDIGNARRFLHWAGDDVRHVTHVGWHVFDGKRWQEDESGSIVRRHAHRAAEAIFEEAKLMAAPPDDQDLIDAGRVAREALSAPYDPKMMNRDQLFARTKDEKAWREVIKLADEAQARLADHRANRHRHAKSACGTSKLNAMLTEASAYRPASVDDLNRDIYAFNVGNGTLRFYQTESDDGDLVWRVRLDPHRRDDLISKLAPVDFSLDAPRAKAWENFLVRVQPSVAMRGYLQRLVGYALLGLNTEQMIAFFFGIGRNGKSTFVDTLAKIFADYAVTLSIDSFAGEDKRSGSEATPDLARLPGARLVAASEPDTGVRFKEALIKRLTGGESIAVRRLHQDFFEFAPQFTLLVSGNHKPVIVGNDDGIWRRIHLVPWNEQISKDEVDKDLPNKLLAEAAGILKWAVEGAVDFLNVGGLNPPSDIIDATQEYREEEDPIGSFIRHACDVTGDDRDTEKPFDLFCSYERFCIASGTIKVKDTTFYRRLPDAARRTWPAPDGNGVQQFHKAKTNGTPVYRGIRIRDEWVSKGMADQTGKEAMG